MIALTPEEKAVYFRLRRYESSKWFGWGVKNGDGKATPVHVNGRHNPRPLQGRGSENAYRVESILTQRLHHGHLTGHLPLFHLSSGERPTGLLALDGDGDAGVDWQDTSAYLRSALSALFPDLLPFCEPGRSWPRKGGAYAWFRVAWSSTMGPLRRAIEGELNRLLKNMIAAPPAGMKFDALKGRTTFEFHNPHFDSKFANEEPVGFNHKVYREGVGEPWQSAYELKQEYKWRGLSKPDLASFQHAWMPISRQEDYETEKVFYGCSGPNVDPTARFNFDPRLEATMRAFGILVTRPCFKALGGERENNLRAFLEWTDNPAGELTIERVLGVLPPDAVGRIARVAEAVAMGVWPRVAPLRRTTQISVAAPANPAPPGLQSRTPDSINQVNQPDQPERGIDWVLLKDGSAVPEHRYAAAARIGLRESGGDQEGATQRALELMEMEGGPSDGPRHPEREARVRRFVAYAAITFTESPAGGRPPREPYFDPANIIEMGTALSGRISNQLMAHAKRLHPAARSLDRLTIAAVACWYAKNIATGNVTEVPFRAIARGLKALGMSRNNSTIAAATDVLQWVGQFKLNRNHSAHPIKGERGRCRCWVLAATAIIPAWLAPHVTARMREQPGLTYAASTGPTYASGATAPASARVLSDATMEPAPSPSSSVAWPLFSFSIPPDNRVLGNSAEGHKTQGANIGLVYTDDCDDFGQEFHLVGGITSPWREGSARRLNVA